MRAAILALVLLTGCGGGNPWQGPQALPDDKPVGAWSPAHTKDWSNGVEVFVVNTRTGATCSVFFSNDKSEGKERVSDHVNCQNPAIFAD